MPFPVGITMCPRAQSIISLVPPVHGVVAAFETRLGKIADFVLPETRALQPAHNQPEHLRFCLLFRQQQLVLHIEAMEQGILLHLQPVD
ncbi:hypothetical protein D3C76_1489380 [compost metagenome]